jgi:hypothetical protein
VHREKKVERRAEGERRRGVTTMAMVVLKSSGRTSNV